MKIIKITTLMLGLFVLAACTPPKKSPSHPYYQPTLQQCEQKTADLKQAYDELKKAYRGIKQDYQSLLEDYQNCLENKLPSVNKAYREIKQDYRDARLDQQRCQRKATALKNKVQSCQVRLKLHKDNQEGYKQLPDKGFE